MNCEISGDKSKANLVDLDDGKTHSVAVQTSKGDFTFDLATKTSPCVTASFAGLVDKGFFDGLTFHRIVPGFVIQGGDPEGNGMGGPGYSVVDAPPPRTRSTRRASSRWRSRRTSRPGPRAASSSSSPSDGVNLPPDYAVLGDVTQRHGRRREDREARQPGRPVGCSDGEGHDRQDGAQVERGNPGSPVSPLLCCGSALRCVPGAGGCSDGSTAAHDST